MPINKTDMDDIKKELDERYVLQADCNDIQREYTDRLHKNEMEIHTVTHDVAAIKKTQYLIFGAVVTEIVTIIGAIILKFIGG